MNTVIPFTRKISSTEIHNVISHNAACQSGKTTWALEHILDNLNIQDHIFFTYNLKDVLADATNKFKEKCNERGITVPIITDKDGITEAYKRRLKGDMAPIVAFLLGNIFNMIILLMKYMIIINVEEYILLVLQGTIYCTLS